MKLMKVDSSQQLAKHDFHKCETGDGLTIVVNPEWQNADSSISCNFDP
jgi:hypothetical protein